MKIYTTQEICHQKDGSIIKVLGVFSFQQSSTQTLMDEYWSGTQAIYAYELTIANTGYEVIKDFVEHS